MTDVLSGPELVEKAFAYMTTLTRECRKALTAQFTKEYKGLPFDSVEPTMRKAVESWFAERDKNVNIRHDKSTPGRPGEFIMTYLGSTKDAHFKFHINSQFMLTGTANSCPAYLKSISVTVDKREFRR